MGTPEVDSADALVPRPGSEYAPEGLQLTDFEATPIIRAAASLQGLRVC